MPPDPHTPSRIVCLSAESADWLWRIGAWPQVVGVTAYFEQPLDAPLKPRVSGFSSANLDQIRKLEPDLVITFSDVQADLAGNLAKSGYPVFATNQRTLAETESTLAMLARVVGRETEGAQLLGEFRKRLAPVEPRTPSPRVYFEEWNDPLISGIGWVGELIERAGGVDIFPELRLQRAAMERVVTGKQVCRADPEIIFASWCGKPVQVSEITSRAGWQNIAAVRNGQVHEISSHDILQPGFRLVHGFELMKRIIGGFRR